MPPKPTPPLAHAPKTQQALAAADQQHHGPNGQASKGQDRGRTAHPARHTKRRAARKRRGLKAQQNALSPKHDKGLRGQQEALRPARREQDPVQAQINRDAAREAEPAPRAAAYYRQHPDLVPPKAVRAQMREDDMPAELVQMDDMPIEAELTLGEQNTVGLAGEMVISDWYKAASQASAGLFRKVVVGALRGGQPKLLDKAQDVFFESLPGPVGKIRKSLEGMAKASAPKPSAQADAVVRAFQGHLATTQDALRTYVSDHQLELAKMVKDRDGKITAGAKHYMAEWRAAPFYLPGPNIPAMQARFAVRLQALYYQAMAQATCDAGAGTPGLCYPEKLADPARWREDARRAVGKDESPTEEQVRAFLGGDLGALGPLDNKANFAKERMGW